ncbi:hypothetical protein B484DRAFT_392446 [Ochromonadaceae sp. CCMP2298]|nr:hypothetical protein B484DRAFT_392446 [Ochromonadaceae sp. CCMP2298]
MIAFFEMASYFIALFVPDPRDFWVLTSVSAGMIGFALVVYTATNTGTWGRGGNRDAGGYSAVAVAETCRYESPTKNSTNPAASISPFAGQRGQGGQGGHDHSHSHCHGHSHEHGSGEGAGLGMGGMGGTKPSGYGSINPTAK